MCAKTRYGTFTKETLVCKKKGQGRVRKSHAKKINLRGVRAAPGDFPRPPKTSFLERSDTTEFTVASHLKKEQVVNTLNPPCIRCKFFFSYTDFTRGANFFFSFEKVGTLDPN